MRQPNLKTHMTICAPRPPPLQHLPVSTHDEPQSMAQQTGLCLLLATPTWKRLSMNFPVHFSHTWMPTPLHTKQSVEVVRAANSGYQKQCLVPCFFFPEFPCSIQIAHLRCYVIFSTPTISSFATPFFAKLQSWWRHLEPWNKDIFYRRESCFVRLFFTFYGISVGFCWFLLAPFLRVSIYEFSGERSFILKKHTWKLQWYNSPRLASKCQTMQLWQSRDCQKGKITTRTSYNCNGGDCQNLLWQMVL